MEYYWKKKTIVSFVLALLVVFIHTSAAAQYILQLPDEAGKDIVRFFANIWTNTVSRVAVPLFFVISGATFFRDYKPEMYNKKLLSRVKTLLIPYLLWNTLVMCFLLLCAYTPVYKLFVGRDRFLLTLPNVINGIFFYKGNGVFWFVYNLIIYVVLTPLFDLLTSKKWLAYISLMIALVLPLFADEAFSFVRMSSGSVVFYLIGCVIGKYRFSEFSAKFSKPARIAGVFICAVCIVLQMLSIYNIVPLHEIAEQVLLIMFCFAFWVAMDIVAERIEVRRYMSYSFFIYVLHTDVQSVLVKIIYIIGPKKIWMAFPNLVISYCGTILSIILVATLMEKYLPKVFSLLTGGRSQFVTKKV
ncbi:acyltransferase [Ruminococcus sp.]|uniref:acyltransferase family protein n=1 Tax=Ruminococcus sp. TaxID=41978 RepID=UPI0025E2CD1A|nr:acyltransferase [Ruminococcus sp.]MBR1431519.1 acyltransferase [Ruminococcus sp.]